MGEAKVILSAQDRGSAVINHVSGRLGILNKQGIAMGVAFAGVTMGLNAMMQGFQAIRGWLDEGVKKFREFSRAMSEVATMLSITNQELLPAMRDAIVDMSLAFGKGAIDLSRGMYQILSAGIDASGAIDVLRTSTKLAAATLSDVETAVDAVTTVLNAYSMSALQAEYVAEIMAKTIQLGKLRMDDLSNALGTIVPIAAQAGVSFEEISAAIAALTKQGIDANTATMSLRQIINSIIAPSQQSMDAMVDLGIAFDDLTLESVGLHGTLEMISDAAKGQISIISTLIPNVRALSGALGLMAADGTLFAESLDYINSEFNALNKMYADVSSSADFQYKKIQTLRDEYQRLRGEQLQPLYDDLEKAGDAIVRIATDWKTFVPGMGIFTINEAIAEQISLEERAKAASKEALDTEKIELYAAEFERLNEYIGNQEDLITRLTARHGQYIKELGQIQEQKEIAIATHDYKEALRYIPLGLEEATYANKIFDSSTRDLINSIRLQSEEIERLNNINTFYSIESQKNQLDILKIQYMASGHRGRLKCTEKKRIEDLQRANDLLQINTLENQIKINETKSDMSVEEKRLESIKRYYNEQIYIITDTYQQDLEAFDNQIKYKQQLMDDYAGSGGYLEIANQNIVDANQKMHNRLIEIAESPDWTIIARMKLAKLLEEYGISFEALTKGIPFPMEGWSGKTLFGVPIYGFGGKQRGGLIPGAPSQPIPIIAHGGERITPRGGAPSGAVTIKIAPMTFNATIRSEADIHTLAIKLQQAISAGIVSGIETIYR